MPFRLLDGAVLPAAAAEKNDKKMVWLEKIEKFASSTYGSRKFMLAGAIFVVATIALFAHIAQFEAYAGLIKWTAGTFFGAHAVTDAAMSLAGKQPDEEK